MITLLLPMIAFLETTPPSHNLQHEVAFGKHTGEINRAVLASVDKLQATAPEGGGYFAGVKAVPAESPIGIPLTLFGKPILNPQ